VRSGDCPGDCGRAGARKKDLAAQRERENASKGPRDRERAEAVWHTCHMDAKFGDLEGGPATKKTDRKVKAS